MRACSFVLLLSASFANAALHAPKFDGIFASFNPTTAQWAESDWRRDLQSMKDVSMSFFVVPHTVHQSGPPTAACKSGTFNTYFPSSLLPSACFTQAGNTAHAGGSVGAILAAANATGLSVHLGLAYEKGMDWPSNVSSIKTLAWLQWEVAQQLWALATSAGLSQVLGGFYTEVEESNGASWLSHMADFATHYLQSLSVDIKSKLRSDLLVWASPYAVLNRTRYSARDWVLPTTYAGMWEETFAAWAPSLDAVALQDSTGALANSFSDVREILGNLSAASARQGKSQWANVELFEVWPTSCQFPSVCHGRHPAPFSRIRAQLENEAPLLLGSDPKVIAWEWSSCLSPTANNGAVFPDANRANYEAYKTYLAVLDAGA